MKRDDDIPIDGLPDTAWNRIERAVFEELDASASASASPAGSEAPRRAALPRWAAVALASVVALQLALTAAFLLTRGEPTAQPIASTRFATNREPSETLLGDVAVRLDPGSAIVVVENPARNSLVVLERGAAGFSVPHRSARPAFVVQAGDARVEVVGTRFRVARAGGSAEVETFEGTVRVTAHGETRLLGRGQRWSGAPEPVAAEPPPAPAAAPVPEADADIAAGAPRAAAESPLAGSDLQRRFEQAARREKREPRKALRIYRSLAQEQGPWAQNALYASARLQIELGERTSARAALQRYLDLYPHGANAADARALLARLR